MQFVLLDKVLRRNLVSSHLDVRNILINLFRICKPCYADWKMLIFHFYVNYSNFASLPVSSDVITWWELRRCIYTICRLRKIIPETLIKRSNQIYPRI